MPRKKLSKKAAKKARKETNRKHYIKTRYGTFENRLANCLFASRKRAKKSEFEFSICAEDFEIQTHCRLLKKTEFCHTNKRGHADTSMSIDRIDPRIGYTKANTWLICQRANRIKNNATFEEFEEIYLNWKAEIERWNNAKGE